MGLLRRILWGTNSEPPPNDLKIGCTVCKLRSPHSVQACHYCQSNFVSIMTCNLCGWKEGVISDLFAYRCDGCRQYLATEGHNFDSVFNELVTRHLVAGWSYPEAIVEAKQQMKYD